ncbi:hypothetical protein [Bifidobacterium catulorum]|uniref:Uncharacterized protein n=1 Tax=Bifidobacterium catulorum TaxID=1630173 RepID=A0A2U2MSG7_9BIFI|nr:hypothetical protein [Bifidobacterium catulorum]PWG59773.1 hypothetical protein DF200_05955 [Bifidobacterium catulorum]
MEANGQAISTFDELEAIAERWNPIIESINPLEASLMALDVDAGEPEPAVASALAIILSHPELGVEIPQTVISLTHNPDYPALYRFRDRFRAPQGADSSKVVSYGQAREIVGRVSGKGVENTDPDGSEDDTYYWVPLIHDSYDDCCWAVDKKTGKAERLGTGPLMFVAEPKKR